MNVVENKVTVSTSKSLIPTSLTLMLVVFFNLLLIQSAIAVCPLCTVAVSAGIGFSRWFGVDDVISGLWIGGLTVSLIVWSIDWLNKKNIRFFGRRSFIVLIYYALMVVPLYWYDFIGHALNKLWGIDKLLLGIIVGSIAFALGVGLYVYLKKKNDGKAQFPFQKVIMPVAFLFVLSVFFHYFGQF